MVRPCVRFVRSCVRVEFNSLWAAVTLTVHINAFSNESTASGTAFKWN